ncbi:MAG: hypothetical protein ABGY75_09225 [Gemmataceae bacterium]
MLVALAGTFGATAAPVPKELKKKSDFYPLAVGNRWEYEAGIKGDRVKTRSVYEVSKVEAKDGIRVVTVTVTIAHPNQDPVQLTNTLRESKDGVELVTRNGIERDPPERIVSVSMQPGETWTVKREETKKEYTQQHTVGKPEEVTVPAGKFQAVPVVIRHDIGGTKYTSTFWYADGVGMVKMAMSNHVTELKEFTPGK